MDTTVRPVTRSNCRAHLVPARTMCKRGAVCYSATYVETRDTYLAAPEQERTHGTHTVSVDEMTGIQALERNAPSKAV